MLLYSTYAIGDSVWVEDRWVSGNQRIGLAETKTLSDVIATLVDAGSLTEVNAQELVRRQRCSGLGLVPNSIEELEKLLMGCRIRDGRMLVTPDLAAWKWHIDTVVSFAQHLQLPQAVPTVSFQLGELGYLFHLGATVCHVVRLLWEKCSEPEASVRATWILNHAPWDVRSLLVRSYPQFDGDGNFSREKDVASLLEVFGWDLSQLTDAKKEFLNSNQLEIDEASEA
jgi:hypothetical protein